MSRPARCNNCSSKGIPVETYHENSEYYDTRTLCTACAHTTNDRKTFDYQTPVLINALVEALDIREEFEDAIEELQEGA